MKKSNDILMPEFERLLKNGHMVEFVPRGVSMRPFIEGGSDKVILHECKRPAVGMIVLAKVNDTYVLHRIYKIEGKQIILQGDGNLTGSETCTAADIIGYVVRLKNKDGKRLRLTKGTIWRHLPTGIKRFYLKIYRVVIKIQAYENED
jgi:hypothetical protein